MHGVASLLAAAAAAHILARLFRAPAIPFLVVAGLVLASIHAPPAAILEDALVLGVSFLLFVAGTELDPRRVRAQWGAAWRVGLIQFAVLAVLGFAAARALGFDLLEAGYLALALTASSTLIGVRLLQKRRQMYEPFGRLTLGVLLVQDALVLLLIPIVSDAADGWRGALVTALGVAALAALGLAVRRWGAPLLLRIADDEELILLVAFALLSAFMGAAHLLAVPLVVGAFIAGVALARFPVNGIVRIELAPISDFFSAIFFTALGALVQLPGTGTIVAATVLALVVLVVTAPLVTVIAERTGLSARAAIESGLLLSQTSEISLVIGLTGMLQGHISAETFTVIALVTLVTMTLTPVIATDAAALRLMHLHPTLRRARPGEPPSDHVLLVGAGSTGMPLLEDLMVTGLDIVVLDDDPGVIERLQEAEIRTVRGDASDPRALTAAGADRARVIASTIRRPRDNEALLRIAGDRAVLIRVFDRHDAEWVERNGGIPVLYSEATADALLEWFEEEAPELAANLERRNT